MRESLERLKPQHFVNARLYRTEEEVVQDALRLLLRTRPQVRINLAVHYYQTADISLAKAASLAGVSWIQMKEILLEQGVPLQLGPANVTEADQEVQSLREYFARCQ
jgi:predicted HTH domain antitoxin